MYPWIQAQASSDGCKRRRPGSEQSVNQTFLVLTDLRLKSQTRMTGFDRQYSTMHTEGVSCSCVCDGDSRSSVRPIAEASTLVNFHCDEAAACTSCAALLRAKPFPHHITHANHADCGPRSDSDPRHNAAEEPTQAVLSPNELSR